MYVLVTYLHTHVAACACVAEDWSWAWAPEQMRSEGAAASVVLGRFRQTPLLLLPLLLPLLHILIIFVRDFVCKSISETDVCPCVTKH